MKKTLMLCVSIVALLLFSSAFTGNGISPSVGHYAPRFSVGSEDTSVSLEDCRGKYVVLSFWTAADARSRLRCKKMTSVVDRINSLQTDAEEKVCFVAVNFDRSYELFREIVRRDNLDDDTQFYVEGEVAGRLRRDYDLDSGYNTFLINPEGRIEAVNPSSDYLTQNLSL